MRALGYSFESAIADIVDNSISAGAGMVRIRFSPDDEPYVAVIDDGCGMSREQLLEAMRHGSRDPNAVRHARDLGRFGLGLKTASLSQCRCLTVASVRDGEIAAARWDLDVVAERHDWILLELPAELASQLPHAEDLLKNPRGTLVLWQRLDRLSPGESTVERALGDNVERARLHISLVFHEYLAGDLALSINENPVSPVDPFLTWHPATQRLPEQRVPVEGVEVRVAPFILPHSSKLSSKDIARAGGEENLRRHQGFYVYRNHRLIIWGTWFRLARQQDLSKLARVRIDIPNSLDHLWTLDIKKSAAYPPEVVRAVLRTIIDRIAESSASVYTFRGRRAMRDGIIHSWDRTTVRGGIVYSINRDHHLIRAVEGVIPEEHGPLFEQLLQTIEGGLPYDSVYADMAAERQIGTASDDAGDERYLKELAERMLDAFGRESDAASQLIKALPTVEPFSAHPEIARKIQEKLADAS